MNRRTTPLAYGLIVLGAAARLLPHPPNFTPVGGLSLFAGARIAGWQAWLLPLLLMAATDAVLGFSISTPFVYASLLVNVWIGRRFARTGGAARIAMAAAVCSAQFFTVTNFAAFLGYYPHTWQGLVSCYAAALPFFARTLAGDLLWSGALFGIYALASRAGQPLARPA